MNPSGSAVLDLLVVILVAFFVVDRSAYAEKDDVNITSVVNLSANPRSTSSATHLAKNNDEKSHGNGGNISEEEVGKSNVNDKFANETKGKTSDGLELKDTNNNQSSISTSEYKNMPVEDLDAEGCDPYNRCNDKKNKFVACLRVPGEDSLDISLLIQNRGRGALDVKIIAPDFISMESTSVSLKGEENKEVKVSVLDGANDTTIVLKAGDGNCSLRLSNMIPAIVGSKTPKTGFQHLPLHTSSVTLVIAALIFIVAAWLFVKIWRTCNRGASSYEKVEMELPLSAGGDEQFTVVDGWDNSWGDDWEDEETPKTPLKSVATPSSKGLASRKSNKDGWKD